MNLWFRFIWLLICSPFRKRLEPLETPVRKFRALPNDIDSGLHVNNARYFSFMDLGRIDWLLRTGILTPAIRRKWVPTVGSQFIRFRKPLKCFKTFELQTKLICFDDKWCYIEQTFLRKKTVMAIGYVKAMFTSSKGNIPPKEYFELVNKPLLSPQYPQIVEKWKEIDKMTVEKMFS